MKKERIIFLGIAIFGVFCIAAYAVNKSKGCVKLVVPEYLEFEFCSNLFMDFPTIYFESGKSRIPRSEYDKLHKVADHLTKNKNLTVRLVGHTDEDLGISHERLSQNRADSVKYWLQEQGISEKRIRAYGLGHSKPVLKEDGTEDKPKSRRVEIKCCI